MATYIHLICPPKSYKLDEGIVLNFASENIGHCCCRRVYITECGCGDKKQDGDSITGNSIACSTACRCCWWQRSGSMAVTRFIQWQWCHMSVITSQIANSLTACSTVSLEWYKRISKSALLALCEGNPFVNAGFPSQRTSNAEMFPCRDVDLALQMIIFAHLFSDVAYFLISTGSCHINFRDKHWQGNFAEITFPFLFTNELITLLYIRKWYPVHLPLKKLSFVREWTYIKITLSSNNVIHIAWFSCCVNNHCALTLYVCQGLLY